MTIDNFAPHTAVGLTTPDGKKLSFTTDTNGQLRHVIRTRRGLLPTIGISRGGLPFSNSVTAAGR